MRLVPQRGLQLLLLLPTVTALTLPPSIVRLERASRALAATLIYEGIIQQRDPLALIDDEQHAAWWFEGGTKSMAAELAALGAPEREYSTELPPASSAPVKNNSPLLAARAKRAQQNAATRAASYRANLQTPLPVPEGAVPEGPETAAEDLRSKASKGLTRAKLAALQANRAAYEETIDSMLDPLAAANLPAFDVAVMLLFLSELEASDEEDLPVPVACNEAVALSVAYSGDEQKSHRHINGLLVSYAREQLGRRVPERSLQQRRD